MNKKQDPKYIIIGNDIYNRATGQVIPANEPVMIFRAKDLKAINALQGYLDACNDSHHRSAIKRRMADFAAFKRDNPSLMKQPDTAPVAIAMHACKSSNVDACGYDADTQTLAIRYGSGLLYHYASVPAEVYAELQAAESVGKFIAQRVNLSFESVRMDSALEPETAAA